VKLGELECNAISEVISYKALVAIVGNKSPILFLAEAKPIFDNTFLAEENNVIPL
jgi:hypothetical protein